MAARSWNLLHVFQKRQVRQKLVHWTRLPQKLEPKFEPESSKMATHVVPQSSFLYESLFWKLLGTICHWLCGTLSIMFECFQENIDCMHYLLSFKHIDLFENSGESTTKQHMFEDASGKGLGIGFWSRLELIWMHFRNTLGSETSKLQVLLDLVALHFVPWCPGGGLQPLFDS